MAEERHGQLPLELDCSAYEVKGPSFSPAPDGGAGGLFACSVGPLPDETMAALDEATRSHAPVRLLFAGHPLLVKMMTLERKGAHRVRIVGFVTEASEA